MDCLASRFFAEEGERCSTTVVSRQAAFRAHSSKHAQRLAWTAVGDATVTRVDHNQCALGAARVEKGACKLVPQVFLKLRPC